MEERLVRKTEGLAYTVIFSDRRRRSIVLRVTNKACLEVRAPKGYSLQAIEQLVIRRKNWVMEKVQQKTMVPALSYETGSEHYYLGQIYTLDIMLAGQAFVKIADTKIIVTTSKDVHVKFLLESWYRQQALAIFNERLCKMVEKLPWVSELLPPLKIRRMRSRWGSCSGKGNISLNLHLIKAPIRLIDYIIVHELCHLQQMNHSPAFYALMSAHMPDWKKHDQELKALTANLLRT